MNFNRLQELASAHALGTLGLEDAALLEQIAAHDPAVREEAAALINTAASFARNATPAASPPPQLRGRILERIHGTPQARPAGSNALPSLAGFEFKRAGEGGWRRGLAPGSRFKPLSVSRDTGCWMLLIQLQPGATIPTHDHLGSEQVYVLSGDLVTEGRTLGPGDFLHAEPGTHHHELVSPHGCMALLIEKAPPHMLAAA